MEQIHKLETGLKTIVYHQLSQTKFWIYRPFSSQKVISSNCREPLDTRTRSRTHTETLAFTNYRGTFGVYEFTFVFVACLHKIARSRKLATCEIVENHEMRHGRNEAGRYIFSVVVRWYEPGFIGVAIKWVVAHHLLRIPKRCHWVCHGISEQVRSHDNRYVSNNMGHDDWLGPLGPHSRMRERVGICVHMCILLRIDIQWIVPRFLAGILLMCEYEATSQHKSVSQRSKDWSGSGSLAMMALASSSLR